MYTALNGPHRIIVLIFIPKIFKTKENKTTKVLINICTLSTRSDEDLL